MPKHKKGLTDKQRAFALEYLIDFNATQAATRAGYSTRTANKIGPELLGKTRIMEAIQAAQDARAKRTGITVDKILLDIDAIREDAMRMIDGEMRDRIAGLRACELQGKHKKMFTDKTEVSGADGAKLFNEIRIISGKCGDQGSDSHK